MTMLLPWFYLHGLFLSRNDRVAVHPPYAVFERRMKRAMFIWQDTRQKPHYNHASLEKFMTGNCGKTAEQKSLRGTASHDSSRHHPIRDSVLGTLSFAVGAVPHHITGRKTGSAVSWDGCIGQRAVSLVFSTLRAPVFARAGYSSPRCAISDTPGMEGHQIGLADAAVLHHVVMLQSFNRLPNSIEMRWTAAESSLAHRQQLSKELEATDGQNCFRAIRRQSISSTGMVITPPTSMLRRSSGLGHESGPERTLVKYFSGRQFGIVNADASLRY